MQFYPFLLFCIYIIALMVLYKKEKKETLFFVKKMIETSWLGGQFQRDILKRGDKQSEILLN